MDWQQKFIHIVHIEHTEKIPSNQSNLCNFVKTFYLAPHFWQKFRENYFFLMKILNSWFDKKNISVRWEWNFRISTVHCSVEFTKNFNWESNTEQCGNYRNFLSKVTLWNLRLYFTKFLYHNFLKNFRESNFFSKEFRYYIIDFTK